VTAFRLWYILRMVQKHVCALCDQPEAQCKCDVRGYCSLCYGDEHVRLCEDGYYYCQLCREICDYRAEN
jgi:hypothetical protein